mmetsp:Transcript_7353/g.14011  ORF Transcript_7353/g.14011 Transcript_7353/m.14011 type:complete len:147 (+) Transcript_7353:159-599(+)|eukprot:scaffold3421_cov181-Amphora_coffeaeformis.AAC.12
MSDEIEGETRSTTGLQSLPNYAISSILQHCSDFQSILSIAQNEALRQVIYSQSWKCGHCHDQIYMAPDLTTRKHANPFMCSVCHGKFCGEAVDYDKRFCRPQKCDGCGKLECHKCLEAHMDKDDGYGTESYCQECQAEFEFGMGGC